MTLVRQRPPGQVAPAALSRSCAPGAAPARYVLMRLQARGKPRAIDVEAARSARGHGENDEMPLPAHKPTAL
jgi:hypothetical protein